MLGPTVAKIFCCQINPKLKKNNCLGFKLSLEIETILVELVNHVIQVKCSLLAVCIF